jgi:hypothetical protein
MCGKGCFQVFLNSRSNNSKLEKVSYIFCLYISTFDNNNITLRYDDDGKCYNYMKK